MGSERKKAPSFGRVAATAVGFVLEAGGCAAFSNIPPVERAGLCFVHPGPYHYAVEVQGGLGSEGAPPPVGISHEAVGGAGRLNSGPAGRSTVKSNVRNRRGGGEAGLIGGQ